MKKMRKLLSLSLTLCIMLSLMPLTAFSEEAAEVPHEHSYAAAEPVDPTEPPAEGQAEDPIEQPAEGEGEGEPAEQPAEGEGESEPVEQPTEGEGEDQPIEQPTEGEGESEPAEQPTEGKGEGEPAEQPAEGVGESEPAEDEAEGEPVEEEIPEPVAFEQSRTVNGVIVTVKADLGVFPAGAELSVETVPVYQQQQADAAVDEVRDENQNVAVSYTFDIKVINPETGEEYQPAEGQTVSVSFALAEVADENLETQVYHVTEDEITGELIAKSLDVSTETTPETGEETTAVVETDGFSIYTVEFTYNNLEYVLPGDTSVPMSEILTTLGLTGEVTAVEISDTSLFSASNGTGEWIVTAHQAFSNTEWMKVTINGVVYEIIVTDDSMVSVTYVRQEWNGAEVVSASVTENIPVVPANGSMTSGKYFLNSNVTVNSRVSLTGNTELILGDGYTLDVKGLYIPAGSTLIIYGQSAGTGKIYSHPSGGAAIGGYSGHDNGDIVIHGGTIDARGYDHCAGIGSNDDKTGGSITIYGGTVTAIGGSDGAAIGGGRNCSGGTITIYGGNITANGPTDSDTNENGAGIGGGRYGSGGTIVINGGNITTYSRDGAGIGGGDDGNGGSITINGGTITSTKVNNGQGARIGGGCDAAPGTIIIDGGSVTTVGGSGAGIGGGKGNTSGGSVTINGGVINASGSYGIGSGENGADVAVTLGYYGSTRANIRITASSFGGTVTLAAPFVMSSTGRYFQPGLYSDVSLLSDGALTSWDGAGVMDVAYVNAAGADMGTQTCIPVTEASIVWLEGWYAVTGNVSINTRIQVSGTVNLILADGASLNAAKGISLPQGSHLIIWAQSGGTGALTATGSERYYAGIGGYIVDGGVMSENYGSLTINGGHITATGGEGAAGIGTSYGRSSVLTVNGGEVTATGGKYASGIGAGVDPNEGTSYTYYNCYFGGAYFYGGKTTAYSGVDHNGNILKPIGAGCAITGYSDAFFLNDGMKVLHADIGHMSYDERYCSISSVWDGDNWVIIEPQTEGSVAYTVTVENDDTNGTLSVNTSMAHAGTEVTVSCTPNTGYELDAITVTDGSGNAVSVTNNKFTMPASPVTVSAALRKIDYTVTVNASGLGAVTANCATANYGDTVTLSFAPNDEDCFLSTFTIKDAGNHDIAFDEQTNSFVMPASNVTVTAVYSKTRFRITVNDSEYGSVTAPEKANVGDTVTLTVTPYENCRLVSITAVDAGDSAVAVDQNACTFTMPEANVTITPVFETSYPISIAQDIEHGTITAAQRAYASDTVTLTPVPDAGYGLVAGSYVLTDAPAVTVAADGSFTMPAQAVTVSASFEALDQTLNLSISGAEFGSYTVSVNGTERITVTENTSITVKTDDTITVTCVPGADGRLNQLSVDGTAQENGYTFVMPPSASAVSVEFETVFRALGLTLNGRQYGDYKVSVNGVERATASTATENLIVRVGDEITVTFLPATDGQVEVFYLEDSVGSGEQHHESDILNNQYTFTMPARPIDTLWANVRFGVRNVTETVSYIDENGAEQTVTATVLSGNETEKYHSTSSGFYYYVSLGEQSGSDPVWYVVKNDISYYRNDSFNLNMELSGDVRIIVYDGATLSVEGELKDGSLRIYGQANQTGNLTAGSINYCGSLIVCSGGLTVSGNVSCQDLAIYGGTTAITGTANASESVILGCRSNGDSISFGTLTKGNGASAAVVTGQTLTDGARDYSGDLSDSDLSAMGSKTLIKAHTHEISEMKLIQAVAPTYDPATGEYADGTREHYHCAICGGDFVEVSGSLVSVTDLSLPYFVFWKMPSVSGVCYVKAYYGADADVIIPETVPASLASASAPAGTVITHIDNNVFAGHTELASVTAGSGLCSIGAGAFAGCTALTDFTTTAAQAVSYVYNDTNGLQDSFASVTNLTIHATHASKLYQAAVDYGFTFIVTDRHSEPTWTWAEDLSSATATFDCNGTCQLAAPDNTVTDDSPTVTAGEDGTVYTASVTVGGEVYSDTKTAADTWAQLQAQINAASDGATITLYRNITALAGNGGLVIPQNKDITLNLNGFTLDRHLSEAAYNGEVITVAYGATLTLTGNGTITGGKSRGYGGGVVVANGAVLNINGGSITGNSASVGGGVYLEPEATLNMTAGSIIGNTAETAGGVYVTSTHQEYESGNTVTRNKSIIRLSGSPVITGNTGGNVYLADGEERPVILVTAALNNAASIGVTAEATGVITSGWAEKMPGHDPESTFVSDNAGFMVFTDSTGEAAIDSCWQRLQVQINAASDGATITLDRDITALAGNGGLVIPQNKDITLNLNGFTLDRHLSEAAYNGEVITVAYGAMLTLTGNGTITGGKSRGYGGGIVVAPGAVLNMNGGSITGNSASVGGGVYLEPEATLNMTAGSIIGNTAETAGGVYVTSTHQEYESGNTVTRNKANIRISGSPVISGNSGGNVYLADGEERPVILVTAALNNAASIGVTAEATGVFTSGWSEKMSGNDPEDTFVSDNAGFLVFTDSTGEAAIDSCWHQLQVQIDAASDGATITLTRDYTALESDAALRIPYGKTVTLDMNGHTLDRGLADSAPLPSGYVVSIGQNAILNLVGSGTITGGSASDGGGINMNWFATLNMSGGTVTGNKATNGGGIYVNQFATLNMSGGSITGNEAQKGAVYIKAGDTVNTGGGSSFFDPAAIRLSGSPVITGNTGGNVYLADGEVRPVIQVIAALADTAAIGVTAENPPDGWLTIVSGLTGEGDKSFFTSDVSNYVVVYDGTNQEAGLRRQIPDAQVLGHNLTLKGEIGINTYLILSNTITENASNYQVEYWNGDKLAVSQKVSEVTPTTKEVGGNSYTVYPFTVTTVAKEMDTVFTMKIKGPDGYIDFANSNGATVTGSTGLDYSITAYLDDRIANSTDPKMVRLAKDMKAYCIYSRHYFDVRDHGSTEELPSIDGFETVTADDLSTYAYTPPQNIAHFTYKGCTLILEEMTSFRLYFESDDPSALTIKNGDDPLTIHSGTGTYQGTYYVEITNIYAQHLDDMYDFTISNGTDTTTAHHGPLGYAKWALGTDKTNLKYAMMALYHYNRSAEAYFITNP